MGLLNVLVKSGFIGLTSYIMYFAIFYKRINRSKNKLIIRLGLLISIPMIASSFSEPFLVNVKLVYTVFVWCSMSCLISFAESYTQNSVYNKGHLIAHSRDRLSS